jgi:O-antigen biosynthesis protein
MSFSERLIINEENQANIIYDEHLIRYRLAAQLAKGKKVLDIACGSGYGANILSEAGAEKVVAIDKSPEAVAAAQKKYSTAVTHPVSPGAIHPSRDGIIFKIGDAEDNKEPEEFFDLAVSFETIEHLSDPEKYLAEIFRVLKKEGIALISTPNREVFGQKNPFHLKEFTRGEFEEALKKYFKNIFILEQTDGLASLIKGSEAGKIIFADTGAPLYFIAVCAKNGQPLKDLIKESFVSVNSAALSRLRDNPVLKFVDKIYSIFKK